MLEVIFELLFEFCGELFLQLVAELFGGAFKAGWYKIRGRDRELAPVHETSWSVVTGIAAGVGTLLVVPHLAIRVEWLQVMNLLLAPVAAGLLVERVRAWRESRKEFSPAVFAYAAVFGLAFALTRWLFGRGGPIN
ncbi:hypothetical protein [Caenimonas aquaedulcis]|uniref:Uncharacterized protein n=1 Tax=Caenimonas aquaedulcis TaxID=2793270 RepID=A0A931H577_9BURK|nr:hypothetical protein [Caenimonas aquaedulcis]MBG9388829.1 hypothetical protein [Caenimonas aquaedulcis]